MRQCALAASRLISPRSACCSGNPAPFRTVPGRTHSFMNWILGCKLRLRPIRQLAIHSLTQTLRGRITVTKKPHRRTGGASQQGGFTSGRRWDPKIPIRPVTTGCRTEDSLKSCRRPAVRSDYLSENPLLHIEQKYDQLKRLLCDAAMKLMHIKVSQAGAPQPWAFLAREVRGD